MGTVQNSTFAVEKYIKHYRLITKDQTLKTKHHTKVLTAKHRAFTAVVLNSYVPIF